MPLITVRVIPNARKNEILSEGEVVKARVHAPATDGKANDALILLLAEHFKVKRNQIRIIRGEKSRNKLVEIS